MRARRGIGVCLAVAALSWSASVDARMPSRDGGSTEKVQVLDVPFVPQSGELCGGAALAMVLRYWGMPGVLAEDFTALLEPGLAGIRTGALVNAVESYGWTALPLPGTAAEARNHLAQGRPVIALIRAGSGSNHYVVVLARANGWVVLHDPNVGPFRAVRESVFDAAWSETGRWALLVLPPPKTDEQNAPYLATADSTTFEAPEACDSMVEAGILLAQQGDTAAAELQFLAAQSPVARLRRAAARTRGTAISRRGLGGRGSTGGARPRPRSARCIHLAVPRRRPLPGR